MTAGRAPTRRLVGGLLVVLLAGCGAEDDGPPAAGSGAAPDLGRDCRPPPTGTPCSEGLACRTESDLGGAVCTRSCDGDADCPANGVCVEVAASGARACALRCDAEADCGRLRCLPAPGGGAPSRCGPG